LTSSTQILVVDDTPANVRLLEAILAPQGYAVVAANSGAQAMHAMEEADIDLVLLDIVMPEMDGYEVCRRIRSSTRTAAVPVVMVTSSTDQEKVKALEAGADDFIPKPFDRAELLARVRSLLRVKNYHDRVLEQAAQLVELNQTLETRVAEQVDEIQRLTRLRRFLSPQLADLVVSSGDAAVGLESHRRQIAVLFADLRGFTPFAEAAEPEDVMGVLRDYHEVLGELVHQMQATVGYFAGDGLMVFFNDPLPCDEPALSAVSLALQLRERMGSLTESWARLGHNLDFGVGITLGYATLGEIGFEGRFDYGAIGSVVNLASRLCDESNPGQILVSPPVFAAVEDRVECEEVAPMELKGFAKPISPFNVLRLRGATGGVVAFARPGGLSEREAEILALVAAGMSSREIGNHLVLSVRTVERHVANIYAKIGAHGRADATAWAIRNGIEGTLPNR
jgi:class 3 adenylate cyclase/CheY-like chemotaxis protein